MDLDSIMPNNSEWKVSKNRVFKKNIAWIPVFDIIEDNLIYIIHYQSTRNTERM